LGQPKNFITFYSKTCHYALKSMGLGFGSRDQGSRNIPIPDPGSRGKKGTGSRIWKTAGTDLETARINVRICFRAQHKINPYCRAMTTQQMLNKLIKRTNLKGVCPRSANLHRLKGGASSATSPSPPASSTDRGSLGPFLRPIRAKIQGNIYYRTYTTSPVQCKILIVQKCCGSGIRCLFDPWILDPE